MSTNIKKTLELLCKLKAMEQRNAAKAEELYRSREAAAVERKSSLSSYRDFSTSLPPGPVGAWSMLNQHKLRKRLETALATQDKEIDIISGEKDAWANEVLVARLAQKSLSTLIEKINALSAAEREKQEQKMMDEMATIVFGRKS